MKSKLNLFLPGETQGMTRSITLAVFEEEQWNHVEDKRRKYFVWIDRETTNVFAVLDWIEEHCSNHYFAPSFVPYKRSPGIRDRNTVDEYYRIWFETQEDAVMFGLMFGVGDPFS